MSFQLFDRLRAYFRQANIYNNENLFQNQNDINRVTQGGEFINYTSTGLIDQTNLQINRLERYKDFSQMSEMGEVSLALDMYADEGTQVDTERKHPLIIRSKSLSVKEELERLFYDVLNIDNKLRPMFRYLCKYGDFAAEILPTANRDEVAGIRPFDIYNFIRVETRFGDLIGFYFTDINANESEPVFLHPWQVMHLRLTSYETIFAPYGQSILEGSRKDFRRLRLMEDAALVYRLCLRGDSLVWTDGGHKQIKNIKPGDKVYSYDQFGGLHKTTVTYQKCNGKDRIYRVYSRHREIYANATHPILVEVPFQSDKKWHTRLEYVDVKDLRHLGNTTKRYCHRFVLPQLENKEYVKLSNPEIPQYVRLKTPVVLEHETYIGKLAGLKPSSIRGFLKGEKDLQKNNADVVINELEKRGIAADFEIISCWSYNPETNKANEYTTPEIANEDFAQWFGFMIGDGYLSERSGVSEIGFAKGDKEHINEKYKTLFESIAGHCQEHAEETRLGKVNIYSKYFAKFLKDNGFIPGAKNKRIPEWVFQSPRSVQEAFIDGYADADCHKNTNTDYDSYECECCNEMLMRDMKELCHRLGWRVGVVRERTKYGGHTIEDGRTIPDTKSWGLHITKVKESDSERILGVEEVDEDLIYDIGVESELHNFVVNGITVHNTRAPMKRVFTIPVGDIPTQHIPHYLNQVADNFKRQRFYDPTTGEVNWKYNPLIQEDDFWMPVRGDGTGPKVETLPGAENLDQIADIEYFKKKMISALKIPFSRVGIGNDQGIGSDKSLASTSNEFAKAVQWIQREVAVGLKKVALVHLALKGYNTNDLEEFDITLTASSAIDELYRIETWNSRVGVISGLKETGMFPDKWILEHFTDMTEDEIKQMQEIQQEKSSEEEEGELPDIGELPGLGEETSFDAKLQKKVLTEYNRRGIMKIEKQGMMIITPTWSNMASNGELDGLPKPLHNGVDGVIMEDIGEDQEPQYLIEPNNSDEAKEALEENRQCIMLLREDDEEEDNGPQVFDIPQ